MYLKQPYFQGSLCTVTAILWLQLTVPTCDAISHVKCSLPLHQYFPQHCAAHITVFYAVSWLRSIPDVAHVSVSKSDTALYCHLLPHAHISSTKIPSRNDKETGQFVPWLPRRPAGDLASLELGQDFHSGRDITGNPHHYRSTFVSFVFEKEK